MDDDAAIVSPVPAQTSKANIQANTVDLLQGHSDRISINNQHRNGAEGNSSTREDLLHKEHIAMFYLLGNDLVLRRTGVTPPNRQLALHDQW